MEPSTPEMHESHSAHIVFGPFCVVASKRLLTKDGIPVEIGGRALDLLIALLARPGVVLSKRELINQVWPDTIVEEGSLRFHMTGLRRILGDGEDSARYIATQVGVGYAFVAPLEKVELPAVLPKVAGPLDSATDTKRFVSGVGSLPPRIKLIGRETDIQRVADQLAQPKLLTIVGAGGVGKTSLAVEVAHQIVAQAYDRVRFVDLAQVEDADLLLSALAGALDIPAQAEDPMLVLLAHVRAHKLLMVIDNCEHLIDAVSAVLEQIRYAAPNVGLLATSREPLRVRDEYVHWLNPLAFPHEPQNLSLDELLAYPAIKLFVERASSGNTALVLEADGVQLIADMCQRLEGMALPIELAAVRVASHGLRATHALMGELFSLSWAGRRTALPRHQTLRAMLDWSYNLLTPPEQLVFGRLSVFVGPFSQDAAAQVIADGQIESVKVVAILDELTTKGLVTVDHSSPFAAYRLLEMSRAFTREKLAARGKVEVHGLAFRHAAFYTSLLADLGHTPSDIFASAARLANQLGNIRSSLEWSFGPHGSPGLALPLAAASAQVFLHFSLLVECRAWCSRATELLELGFFGTPVEMELQAALGLVLMFTRGNSAAAETALLRALDIAVSLNDYWSQLRLLGRLQIFYERTGDFASSLAWAEQAVVVGQVIGEPEAFAVAASLAGVSHHLLGDQVVARRELQSSLRNSLPSQRSTTIYYGFDHRNRTGLALARTLWLQGFPDQARQWAAKVEAEAAALEHSVTYCIALIWTMCIYIWTGDLDQATASLERFTRIAEENAFGPYMAASRGFEAAIAIRAEQSAGAVERLEESLARLQGMRYELLTTSFEIALVEGLILSHQPAKALPIVEGTISHCRKSGDAFALPELLRLKAEVLRSIDPTNSTAIERLLEESLALSQIQGARAWALRTTMDLALLYLDRGARAQAIECLSGCRAWVCEGFDTLDVRRLDLLWQQANDPQPLA